MKRRFFANIQDFKDAGKDNCLFFGITWLIFSLIVIGILISDINKLFTINGAIATSVYFISCLLPFHFIANIAQINRDYNRKVKELDEEKVKIETQYNARMKWYEEQREELIFEQEELAQKQKELYELRKEIHKKWIN